jgi:hypothetical protein
MSYRNQPRLSQGCDDIRISGQNLCLDGGTYPEVF